VEILERLEGHYEAQEVPFGVVYRWCPPCLVAECECGSRLTLKRSNSLDFHTAVCECGEDCTDDLDQEEEVEVVGQLMEEDDALLHPWRYAGDRKDRGLPY
jgi:hypothetical protein